MENKNASGTKTVLVTGGSGFIAVHCILQLLNEGYFVRTTVRSPESEAAVRLKLKTNDVESGEKLVFYIANLISDSGWTEAMKGCNYVLHLASPFPVGVPKHEDDLIIPARDGALRALKFARNAGVERLVLTSSFAAIGYNSKPEDYLFTEKDWTDPKSHGITAYVKSKAIAERAAWNYISSKEGSPELSVINPALVLGPVLGPDDSTSIQLIKRLMDGSLPGLPHLYYGVVDVRDVADLHIRAMTNPVARNERFLAIAGDFMSMKQIAYLLREKMGEAAKQVPRKELPDWLVRLVAFFDPSIKQVIPELGVKKKASNEKAKKMLNWSPRSSEDAIIATAESLIRFGLIEK